jgi:hypothetical protein
MQYVMAVTALPGWFWQSIKSDRLQRIFGLSLECKNAMAGK